MGFCYVKGRRFIPPPFVAVCTAITVRYYELAAAAAVVIEIASVSAAAEQKDDKDDYPQASVIAEAVSKAAHTGTSLIFKFSLAVRIIRIGDYAAILGCLAVAAASAVVVAEVTSVSAAAEQKD